MAVQVMKQAEIESKAGGEAGRSRQQSKQWNKQQDEQFSEAETVKTYTQVQNKQ